MDEPQVGIERPEQYNDEEWEAYKAGAAAMMEFCGRMLLQMGADIGGQIETGATTGDGDEEEENPETCPDCGMELVYQMGREDGLCPNCDLL